MAVVNGYGGAEGGFFGGKMGEKTFNQPIFSQHRLVGGQHSLTVIKQVVNTGLTVIKQSSFSAASLCKTAKYHNVFQR